MPADPVAWSYSRLNSFETCPKKFWHTLIAKDVPDRKAPEGLYGTEAHKALELRIANKITLPVKFKHFEPIAAKLAAAPGDKLCEQELAINVDFRPVKWFDKDVWCRAKVDLAIVNHTKCVTVDFKTGKFDPDFTQQLLATSLLMLHHKGIKFAEVTYLWLQDRKFTRMPMPRSDMAGFWAELLPRIKRYQHAFDTSEFPARKSGLCKKHCPVTQCIYNGANQA